MTGPSPVANLASCSRSPDARPRCCSYQVFFRFIKEVRGFPLPLIPDEDVAPIVAYMKKAF
jgi:hypothetical protein